MDSKKNDKDEKFKTKVINKLHGGVDDHVDDDEEPSETTKSARFSSPGPSKKYSVSEKVSKVGKTTVYGAVNNPQSSTSNHRSSDEESQHQTHSRSNSLYLADNDSKSTTDNNNEGDEKRRKRKRHRHNSLEGPKPALGSSLSNSSEEGQGRMPGPSTSDPQALTKNQKRKLKQKKRIKDKKEDTSSTDFTFEDVTTNNSVSIQEMELTEKLQSLAQMRTSVFEFLQASSDIVGLEGNVNWITDQERLNQMQALENYLGHSDPDSALELQRLHRVTSSLMMLNQTIALGNMEDFFNATCLDKDKQAFLRVVLTYWATKVWEDNTKLRTQFTAALASSNSILY